MQSTNQSKAQKYQNLNPTQRFKPSLIHEPKQFNFDKCIAALHLAAIKYQQKKYMHTSLVQKHYVRPSEDPGHPKMVKNVVYQSPAKVEFISVLPPLHNSHKNAEYVPSFVKKYATRDTSADFMMTDAEANSLTRNLDQLNENYERNKDSNTLNINRKFESVGYGNAPTQNVTYNEKDKQAYQDYLKEVERQNLPHPSQSVAKKESMVELESRKSTLKSFKKDDMNDDSVFQRSSFYHDKQLRNEISHIQILKTDPELREFEPLLEESDPRMAVKENKGSLYIIPVVSDDQIHAIMEKKRIMEVPWTYINKYRPKKKSDLITLDMKFSLNQALIDHILDYIKIMFKNFKIPGYDTGDQYVGPVEKEYYFEALVNFESKVVSDLIFEREEQVVLFAVPTAESMPDLQQRAEPDYVWQYYKRLMKYLENKNDIDITNKDLIRTLAVKNEIDTAYIDSLQDLLQAPEYKYLSVQQNFTTHKDPRHLDKMNGKASRVYTEDLTNRRLINPARILPIDKQNRSILITKRNEINLKHKLAYQSIDRNHLNMTRPLNDNLYKSREKSVNKNEEEMGKASKNLTSHRLQELSMKYDMTRREIYEMHSTWHSMMDFTYYFFKKKGFNPTSSQFKDRNTMYVVTNMLEVLSNKSAGYQNKIIKALKVALVSPETFKLIAWNDYVKIYLIFKENDIYSSWKIDFWCAFFDPFNRGLIEPADFEETCSYLAEQSKKTDEFLHEKTTIHVRDLLKDYIDVNNNLNISDMRKGMEKKEINLIHFVKYLKGEINVLSKDLY